MALFFLYFFGLTRTGLLSTDEPRYAAIGQAMAQSGDWVTPRLWGTPWFEKPALLYWMTAIGFKAGLDRDLAPRLPVAIASVAFLIYFFFALRREFGARMAACATLVLATCAGWLVYSHVAVTDLPMSAAFAAAMLLVLPKNGVPPRGWPLAAGILLGVAVLAKGLTPIVLFAPAVWFLRHQVRQLLMIAAAAVLVAAPWYAAVMWQNGLPFFQEFIWKHHFLRFFTGALQHERPIWFYVPVVAGELFPWSPLLLLLFSRRLYADRRALFLLIWFAWGFAVFSLSRNKLPGYTLPLAPALAALIAIALEKQRERSGTIAVLLGFSAALLALIPAVQQLLPQALLLGISRSHVEIPYAWLAPALILGAATAWLEKQGRQAMAISLIALGMTFGVVRLVWQSYPVLDRTVSARGRWISSGYSVTCVHGPDRALRYGLDYYSGRNLPDCK